MPTQNICDTIKPIQVDWSSWPEGALLARKMARCHF